QIRSHWYWRQALRVLPVAPGAALAQAWVAHIHVLPATLSMLGSAAPEVIRHLWTPDIATIALALAEAYALPHQVFVPAATDHGKPAPGDVVPPWRPWLPTPLAAGLTPAAEALLGVALALWHAPVWSRSERFAAQAQHWIAALSSAVIATP